MNPSSLLSVSFSFVSLGWYTKILQWIAFGKSQLLSLNLFEVSLSHISHYVKRLGIGTVFIFNHFLLFEQR